MGQKRPPVAIGADDPVGGKPGDEQPFKQWQHRRGIAHQCRQLHGPGQAQPRTFGYQPPHRAVGIVEPAFEDRQRPRLVGQEEIADAEFRGRPLGHLAQKRHRPVEIPDAMLADDHGQEQDRRTAQPLIVGRLVSMIERIGMEKRGHDPGPLRGVCGQRQMQMVGDEPGTRLQFQGIERGQNRRRERLRVKAGQVPREMPGDGAHQAGREEGLERFHRSDRTTAK